MVEVIPSRLAAEVLAGALCRERTDADAISSRLRVSDADRRIVEALLPLLDDVRVDEWAGDSGAPRRDYVGRLPCGLTLVVGTDAEYVPLLLPEVRL